ncbi:hypothetical protein [Ramlibacter rhizophilus]|uniref:Uncharacterized protein n=1 Tax=Ramlibacter rhizophilus TaxID=1781167 RepID=A0A4Z0BRX6_9BURK|nr:hypothetical protein [Ramlibacter rhizophilus]TFZ01492.1 hypothetical protein EZ242_08965 [Ramlibacter rhizophilus]
MTLRLFVGSLMIFFGTLLLAGLLALGAPGGWGIPSLDFEAFTQPGPPPWRLLVSWLEPS